MSMIIGKFCSIACGAKFLFNSANQTLNTLSTYPILPYLPGAINGTRAVVTKDVSPYAIVGGVPARKMRSRFDDATIELLQKLQWCNWDIAKISKNLDSIINADLEALKKLV